MSRKPSRNKLDEKRFSYKMDKLWQDNSQFQEKMDFLPRSKSASLKRKGVHKFNLENKDADAFSLEDKMNSRFDKIDETLKGIKGSIDGMSVSINALVLLSLSKESKIPREQRTKIYNYFNQQFLPKFVNSFLNNMNNEAKNQKDNAQRNITKTPQRKRDNLNKMKRTFDNKTNAYLNKSLNINDSKRKKKYSFKKKRNQLFLMNPPVSKLNRLKILLIMILNIMIIIKKIL